MSIRRQRPERVTKNLREEGHSYAVIGKDWNGRRPTVCALAAPPPIDGKHIVAEPDAEKRMISLDAKRRPLQARVGPIVELVSTLGCCVRECCEIFLYLWIVIAPYPNYLLLAINDNRNGFPPRK